MATEHHDRDERIAEAIRSMADDEGQLTSPPATLWGRIERAIDDASGDASGQPSDLTPPPPELWDRIADQVRAEGASGTPAVVRSRQRVRTIALVAAAVIAVGALAATTLVVRRAADGPATELIATATLTGDGLDPGGDGAGSAELLEGDDGWKVAIEIDRLPSAPAGSYYEAWLLGAGPGEVQSLGALTGNERFAVPDGLAIDDFPLVDVSIEPIDGNPAHSSKSVLRGELKTA